MDCSMGQDSEYTTIEIICDLEDTCETLHDIAFTHILINALRLFSCVAIKKDL